MDTDVEKLGRGDVQKFNHPSDNVFWLYLVTTENDMEVEKSHLYQEVFPKVNTLCQDKGLIFQVVELRQEEYCIRSARHIHSNSKEHCVLFMIDVIAQSLLGEKRSLKRLPKVINAKELKVLLKTGEKMLETTETFPNTPEQKRNDQREHPTFNSDLRETLTFIHHHYTKDQNSIPPCFVLHQDSESDSEASQERPTPLSIPKVVSCLQRVALVANSNNELSHEAMLKYFYPALDSVTRITKAMGKTTPKLLNVKRRFQGFDTKSLQCMHNARKYFDVDIAYGEMFWNETLHHRLDNQERNSVFQDSSLMYTVTWQGNGVDMTSVDHAEYIRKMSSDVLKALSELVTNVYADESFPSSPSDELLKELQHHSGICEHISSTSCGRWEMLSEISEVMQTQSLQVVLYGVPGSGKTYICGKIIEIFSEVHGSSCVRLYRFIQSSESSTFSVFRSICRQLYGIVHRDSDCNLELESFSTMQETLECFLNLLDKIEEPCLILLDGIDLLQPCDFVLSGVLKNLPNNVTCVLSTSSSSQTSNLITSAKDECHSAFVLTQSLNSKNNNVLVSLKNSPEVGPCFIQVPPISSSVSVITMNRVLKDNDRCLTAYQRDQLMTLSAKFPNALFVKLITKEACSWGSSVCSKNQCQKETNIEVLKDFFDSLEECYGRPVVAETLCRLTESKNGLSVIEIIDMMASDPVIVSTHTLQQVRNLPHSLQWLLFDLQHLISVRQEKHSQILTWSHVVLADFVRDRYMPSEKLKCEVHKRMGNYWLRLSQFLPRKSQHQMGIDISSHEFAGKVLDKVPYHLAYSHDEELLDSVLLCPEWIAVKLQSTSLLPVVEDYSKVAQVLGVQGYKNIADALALSQYPADTNDFMWELVFHLQPYASSHANTAGKLCTRTMKWLTQRPGNGFVLCLGPRSSSGPLLKQIVTRERKVCVCPESQELITITESGFVLCYDLAQMTIKRMKRLYPWPAVDSWDNIHFHHREGGLIMAVYSERSVCVFDLTSLDHVKSIGFPEGSTSHFLSPGATFLLSHTSQNGIVISAAQSNEEVLNSLSQPGHEQRHLLFTQDDKYEVFEDKNVLPNGMFQTVLNVFNTSTKSVSLLARACYPKRYQIKACNISNRSIVVGVLNTSDENLGQLSGVVLDTLQRIQFYHLPAGSRNVDIKLSIIPAFLCCNKPGDRMLVGNEDHSFVYKLPEGTLACDIKGAGSKGALLGCDKVIIHGGSVVQVYSSRNGDLIAQWASFDSVEDQYWLTNDDSLLVKCAPHKDAWKVKIWQLPDCTPREDEVDADPPFQCLAFNRPTGLLVGVTRTGHIATMDTFKKVFSWDISTFKISHSAEYLVLSQDASLVVVLGASLSLVDLTQHKLLASRVFQTQSTKGQLIDGCLSADKQTIVAVEGGQKKTLLLHVVKVNQPQEKVTTIKAVPGTVVLRESKVLYLPKRESKSDDSLGRDSFEMIDLFNNGALDNLSIGMPIHQTSVVCFSPNDGQMAVIATYSEAESDGLATVEVTVFDTNLFKMGKKYVRECPKYEEITNAFFLTYYIVMFTDSSVTMVDLLSGDFKELLNVNLLHPIVSKDENFICGIVQGNRFSEVCLLDIVTRSRLVQYPLPPESSGQFLASHNLDMLFFFANGMAHPTVLIANESLRMALRLDKKGYEIPYFLGKKVSSSSIGFKESNADSSVSCPMQNVSQLLLPGDSNRSIDGSESFCVGPSINNNNTEEPMSKGSSVGMKEEVYELYENGNQQSGDWNCNSQRGLEPHRTVQIQYDKLSSDTGSELDTSSGSSGSYSSGDSGTLSSSSSDSESNGETPDTDQLFRKVTSETVHGISQSHSCNQDPALEKGDVKLSEVGEVGVEVTVNRSDQTESLAADTTGHSSNVSGIQRQKNSGPQKCLSWNYFTSSSSEQEYDADPEDNNISTEMELRLEVSKKRLLCGRVSNNESEMQSGGDHINNFCSTSISTQSSEDYDDISDKDGITSEDEDKPHLAVQERRCLVHRPISSNYFCPDEDNNDNTKQREPWVKNERSETGTNVTSSEQKVSDLSQEESNLKKNVSSRSCVLM